MSTGPKKVPATAPGQALGYGLQYTRLTAMLLAASGGSICSLEVLDDIAEQTPDGKLVELVFCSPNRLRKHQIVRQRDQKNIPKS